LTGGSPPQSFGTGYEDWCHGRLLSRISRVTPNQVWSESGRPKCRIAQAHLERSWKRARENWWLGAERIRFEFYSCNLKEGGV